MAELGTTIANLGKVTGVATRQASQMHLFLALTMAITLLQVVMAEAVEAVVAAVARRDLLFSSSPPKIRPCFR